MKKLFLTLLCIVAFVPVWAQDIIVTTSNERIDAKITEVSETEIKYKRMDNLDGPTFIISTNKIASVVYKNGTVQTFNQSEQKAEPQKISDEMATPMRETQEMAAIATESTPSQTYPNEFMESTRNIMDGKNWRLSAVFAPMTFEQERASEGSAKPRWGFQAGGQAHYYFDAVPGLSLCSGLTLAGYFFNLNDGTWDVHSHHVALQIPIRVQYEYMLNDKLAVFGYAGPKFDIGLSNKTNRELGSFGVDTEDYYSSNNTYNAKHRLNFMLGFAAGVRFWDLYVSLGGDFGLNRIYKEDNFHDHTHQFILTLGYYLPWAW